jgi:hypothetical protein
MAIGAHADGEGAAETGLIDIEFSHQGQTNEQTPH